MSFINLSVIFMLLCSMNISEGDRVLLEAAAGGDYDGPVAARARIVLSRAEGHSVAVVAREFGVSRPTVRQWELRFAVGGVDALVDLPKCGGPRTVTGAQRSRIVALTRMSPPEVTGLSHWSARTMAAYVGEHEGISVSHNFVSVLWRENGLRLTVRGRLRSLVTLILWIRSLMSSGCTCRHLRALWCCRWMRRLGSRPLTGHSRSYRWHSLRQRKEQLTASVTGRPICWPR
jgi:transposase